MTQPPERDTDPEYHCYDGEPLTYVDEHGVERFKRGASKVKRAYRPASAHVEGPGEATTCPICSHALVVRNGEAICESGLCRRRIVEDCC